MNPIEKLSDDELIEAIVKEFLEWEYDGSDYYWNKNGVKVARNIQHVKRETIEKEMERRGWEWTIGCHWPELTKRKTYFTRISSETLSKTHITWCEKSLYRALMMAVLSATRDEKKSS